MEQVGTYQRVIGWREISEYFPIAQKTLQARYGNEMLSAGYVFKSVIKGPDGIRRWQVWSFDFLVAAFISQKQAAQGFV